MTTTVLLALALAVPQQMQQMQSSTTDSTISVMISRQQRVVATGASMYVSIDGTAETTTAALARVSDKLRVVGDTISRLGKRVNADAPIPFKVGIYVPPNSYGVSASATSYIANTVLRVHVPHIEDVGVVQAALLSAGAASITGQVFELDSSDSHWRSEAPALVTLAKSNAEALVVAEGRKLGELMSTEVNGSIGQYGQIPSLSLDPRGPNYGTAPEVMVSTNVIVKYRLLSR